MSIIGLRCYGVEVPDGSLAESFYKVAGFEVGTRGNNAIVRCVGRDLDQVIVSEGGRKRLAWVSFSVAPGSLTELTRSLGTAGVARTDGPEAAGDGAWFEDPDGLPVLLTELPLAPARSYEPNGIWNFDGERGRVDTPRWRELCGPTHPRRLGHMIKFTPDLDAVEHFYLDLLGLKLSDRLPGRVTFFNCGFGDHHIFGAGRSSSPGLHHYSFEVANIDEIAFASHQLADAGHDDQWGPGRHTVGSNLFVYVKDPWGGWIEYFADMDQITPAWRGCSWDVGAAVWGPPMPKHFHDNPEAARDEFGSPARTELRAHAVEAPAS
jgi:catechol 2,3-dioxygenase-like lactoylglutathione lyase family enzyme